MPQPCNGLAPEERADILRVRPQGALCIDNQINGYGTYEFADGNRDRPEPNAENRVYFRIHNYGLASAQNVQARVYVALPGAGDSNNRWQFLGSAYFASIPSRGGVVESFVNWTPPADHGGHGCVKVEILPLTNELDTQNNAAQENIFEFESTRNSPWRAQSQLFRSGTRLTTATCGSSWTLQTSLTAGRWSCIRPASSCHRLGCSA